MKKYTWDDIIIDPTSEEAKNCIGKIVYYADDQNICLNYANNDIKDHCGILRKIEPNMCWPFVIEEFCSHWECIIPYNENQKPKYIPFSNKEEFLSAYEEHTNSMKKYGIWIFNNINGIDYLIACLITEMWNDGIVIGSAMGRILWKYLLESFVFEDGTPCGKLQEENNDKN